MVPNGQAYHGPFGRTKGIRYSVTIGSRTMLNLHSTECMASPLTIQTIGWNMGWSSLVGRPFVASVFASIKIKDKGARRRTGHWGPCVSFPGGEWLEWLRMRWHWTTGGEMKVSPTFHVNGHSVVEFICRCFPEANFGCDVTKTWRWRSLMKQECKDYDSGKRREHTVAEVRLL
jgi:hypothetical protein